MGLYVLLVVSMGILLNSNTKAPTLTLLKLMQPTGAGCTDFSCMEVRIPKKEIVLSSVYRPFNGHPPPSVTDLISPLRLFLRKVRPYFTTFVPDRNMLFYPLVRPLRKDEWLGKERQNGRDGHVMTNHDS